MIELLFLTPVIAIGIAMFAANFFVNKKESKRKEKDWINHILE